MWIVVILLIILMVAVGIVVWWRYGELYIGSNIGINLAMKGCPSDKLDIIKSINTYHKLPETTLVSHKPVLKKTLAGTYGNIAIATISVGERPFKRYTLKSLRDYAEKHNYAYIERTDPYEIPNKFYTKGIKDPNWQKLFWLRELIDSVDAEYLVWIDDDILVTNDNNTLESYISMDPDKHLFISHDRYIDKLIFPFRAYLNSGVMILRNSEETREILDAAIQTYYDFEGWYWCSFNDQAAIEFVYFTTDGENYCVFPHGFLQTLHNSGDWRPGDFLYHVAGQKPNKRTKICKELITAGNVPAFNKK